MTTARAWIEVVAAGFRFHRPAAGFAFVDRSPLAAFLDTLSDAELKAIADSGPAVDWDAIADAELVRLANGEDPVAVLGDAGLALVGSGP